MEVIQPSRVVSTDGTAQVKCFIQPQRSYQHFGDQNPEVLRVTLLRGLHSIQEVYSCNFTQQREGGVEREERVSSIQSAHILLHEHIFFFVKVRTVFNIPLEVVSICVFEVYRAWMTSLTIHPLHQSGFCRIPIRIWF